MDHPALRKKRRKKFIVMSLLMDIFSFNKDAIDEMGGENSKFASGVKEREGRNEFQARGKAPPPDHLSHPSLLHRPGGRMPPSMKGLVVLPFFFYEEEEIRKKI